MGGNHAYELSELAYMLRPLGKFARFCFRHQQNDVKRRRKQNQTSVPEDLSTLADEQSVNSVFGSLGGTDSIYGEYECPGRHDIFCFLSPWKKNQCGCDLWKLVYDKHDSPEYDRKRKRLSRRNGWNCFRSGTYDQERQISRFKLGSLIFYVKWYPEYIIELLTLNTTFAGHWGRPLCKIIVSRLFSNPESLEQQLALTLITWHVLLYEFSVRANPLRESKAASYLLASVVTQLSFQSSLCKILKNVNVGFQCLELNRSERRMPKATEMDYTDDDIALADSIVQALFENRNVEGAFPKRLYEICRQIDWLVKNFQMDNGESSEQRRLSMVGGRLLILRYVSPFLLKHYTENEKNESIVRASKLLQELCRVPDTERKNAQVGEFCRRNVPKMIAFVDSMCSKDADHDDIPEEIKEITQRLETMRDALPAEDENDMVVMLNGEMDEIFEDFSQTAEDVIQFSGAEIRLLVKSILISARYHSVSDQRTTLLEYCFPLVQDFKNLLKKPGCLDYHQYYSIGPRSAFEEFNSPCSTVHQCRIEPVYN